MKMHAFAIVVAALWTAADGPSEAAKEEHKKLKGTWVVESVIRDPREKYEGKGIRCVIKGEKVAFELGVLAIKIDPAKKPKAMDLRPEGAKDTILAIYELKGDTLRVCWAPVGKERPVEFASKPGSGHSLVVLKREKP